MCSGLRSSGIAVTSPGGPSVNSHFQLQRNAKDLSGSQSIQGQLLGQQWESRAGGERNPLSNTHLMPGSTPGNETSNAPIRGGVVGTPISLARVLVSAREETARLSLALEQLKCGAQLRSWDGEVSLLWGDIGGNASALGAVPTLAESIEDPEGTPAAALELFTHERDPSNNLHLLLGTFVRAAASALAERWFRIHYRSSRVMIAMPIDAPDKAITLALDRDHEVVGANASARQMLASMGRPLSAGLSVTAFFRGSEHILSSRRYCDRVVVAQGAIDAAPWAVLTTPPATGLYSVTAEQEVLHTRPRHEMLRCLEVTLPTAPDVNGLPPRILRHIEEYIDSHLDTPLNLDELAARAGFSISHFSRCFRNSVGLAPHSYVMRRRLLRAQDLLLDTNMALSEVALITGFSDQSHFSRQFHRFMGSPPRSFRLQHR
jgi:AraC-like DNA-binding protein